MSATDDKEEPLPSAYTSVEVTGLDNDVDKCTAESVKEAHKQTTKMDISKPILKNP